MINQRLSEMPYLTEKNYDEAIPDSFDGDKEELFRKLQECAALLKEKWGSTVNGFWYIAESAIDEGLQIAVRVNGECNKFLLHEDIGAILHHEMLYRFPYDEPSIDTATYVFLDEHISKGTMYTLIDTERDDSGE